MVNETTKFMPVSNYMRSSAGAINAIYGSATGLALLSHNFNHALGSKH
jgi:hypothetical protein